MTENKILPQGLQIPDRTPQIFWTKIAALSFAAVISFGVTWQLLAQGISQDNSLGFWFLPSLAAAIGVVLLAFLSVINRSKYLFLGVNLAILIWYALAMPKDWVVLSGGMVFIILAFFFESRIKDDETSRADFSMSRIIRSSVSIMVYALLIIIGCSIYIKAKEEFDKNPKGFYNQIGHYAARGLEYVPSGLGNFDPDQSFDEFVVEQAKRQNPEFENAPEALKEEAADQTRQQLMERFGIKISGNPLLGQVVAGVVSEKVEKGTGSYQRFFPAIFALLVALLFRSVASLFVWLVYLVSWALFKVLLWTKFFKIEKVEVEVDKLKV
jgi:hypothetical protein